MKKKILILTAWYPTERWPVGGLFIQDQAEALSREYDVTVLALPLIGWGEILRGNAGPRAQVENRAGLRVYRERVLSLVPRAPALAYRRWKKTARKIFQRVLNDWGRPDLIHAHVILPAGWAAVKIGKESSIPVVLTEHSGPFATHLRTGQQQAWVQETLAGVDAIIAVSPSLEREIVDFQNDVAISIIGNLVKTNFFVPAQSRKENSSQTNDSTSSSSDWTGSSATCFLAVALLSKVKGLNYLLHAAKILVERGVTAFEVAIGGDGPERAALERLARSLGLADRCKFLGTLNRNDVRRWMQQSGVLVMPSLHESFCLVLGEALACGIPVISTRCGGPEFIVTPETGVLVDVADATALANAMSDFILGRKKYKPEQLRRSVVERFGEDAFLRNVSAVYEKVWSSENIAA